MESGSLCGYGSEMTGSLERAESISASQRAYGQNPDHPLQTHPHIDCHTSYLVLNTLIDQSHTPIRPCHSFWPNRLALFSPAGCGARSREGSGAPFEG